MSKFIGSKREKIEWYRGLRIESSIVDKEIEEGKVSRFLWVHAVQFKEIEEGGKKKTIPEFKLGIPVASAFGMRDAIAELRCLVDEALSA